MSPRNVCLLAAAILALAAAPASASYAHTVTPGESLYSVAAADGLSISQLAAANGLSADSQLATGTTLMIPPQGGSAYLVPGSTSAPASSTALGDGDGDSDDVVGDAGSTGSAVSAPSVSTSSSGGAYVVAPGDTLTAIATRAGVSVAQLAAANGLDPNGVLLAGKVLSVASGGGSSGASGSATGISLPVSASTQPVGTVAQGSAAAPPYPTAERVSASEVGSIANANGVPPSLADAVGWQESGFNNNLVSSADARGVMQILPGTWDWINRTLTAGTPLAPASAADNVRGGVLLLHSLLAATGGDPALAAAGYYQGLPSVRANGLYSDTQRYVNNVLALERQFGGG